VKSKFLKLIFFPVVYIFNKDQTFRTEGTEFVLVFTVLIIDYLC